MSNGRRASGPWVRLYVGGGRRAGMRPGDLVGAIANEAGVPGSDIGAIQIADAFSLVDVAEATAEPRRRGAARRHDPRPDVSRPPRSRRLTVTRAPARGATCALPRAAGWYDPEQPEPAPRTGSVRAASAAGCKDPR